MRSRSQTRPLRGSAYGRRSQQGGSAGGAALILFVLVAGLIFLSWISGIGPYALWWLTNTEPPSVAVTGPPDVVRGAVQVGVQINPPDRAKVVDVLVDGQSIGVPSPVVVNTAASPDGEHSVRVHVEDTSRLRNQTRVEVLIRSDNTPPKLTVESRPSAVEQGKTLLLRVRSDEPSTNQLQVGGKALELQREGDFWWAVLGIGPDEDPRAVPIVARGADRLGNTGEQQYAVQIAPHKFTEDRVQVAPRLIPLLEASVRAEEDARLAETYKGVSSTRLWSGPFLLPVRGAVVTEFGEVRSYNGGPFEGHHAGIDIAANAGVAVIAPARGKVALIEPVQLRGNVVILDHGMGVFTTYAHLSSTDVKQGDEVQRGQAFAKVGSTGLSEGPHLHWELWVNGQNVDPLQWTEQTFP